jgi:hypothetical protein
MQWFVRQPSANNRLRQILLADRPHKFRVQLGAGELSLLQLFALADQHIDQQLT